MFPRLSLWLTLATTTLLTVVAMDPSGAGRIVNGNDATGLVPYQVKLSITTTAGQSMCGGSLLAADWVLTAAHCMTDLSASGGAVSVVATAGTNAADGTGGTTRTADKIYIYPDYQDDSDSTDSGSDLALLQFSSNPFPLTAGQIAAIPLAASNPPAGTTARITGWGGVNAKDVSQTEVTNLPDATTLQEAFVTVISEATGSAWLAGSTGLSVYECMTPPAKAANLQWSRLVATGSDTDPAKDSCQGDSGGPLAVANATSPVGYTLAAVVSFGYGCAVRSLPSFYSSVSASSQWITATMASPPTLCGANLLTCGPGAECVSAACACKAGYTKFPGTSDQYGYSCGRYLFSGAAQSVTISGVAGKIVYELRPVSGAFDYTTIRGRALANHVRVASGFDGCGFPWYTNTGVTISSVLTEVASVAAASGAGTVPATVWTGQSESSTGLWLACRNLGDCYNLGGVAGQWASGQPVSGVGYAAASVASNALVTQPSTTSTWIVVAYAEASPSPSPSPGSIFLPSSAVRCAWSALPQLVLLGCLALGLLV